MNAIFKQCIIAIIWSGLAPGLVEASTVDALVQALGGKDGRARAVARQLLPREGVAVVPKILPLLASETQVVWRAAFNVLADFANEVSVSGREAERTAVTASLMTLVAPDRPAHIKKRGLRLLALVVPEGHDVGPVAALLGDPKLREKARVALQAIGTTQARAALRASLSRADPDFACALIDALGALRDEASVPVLKKRTGDRSPKVRAAAARALVWTADPAHLGVLRSVRAGADAGTRFEATDALLGLADTVALEARNRPAALHVYEEVLATASDPALQGAAIVGLGRLGSETVVPRILTALKGEHGRTLEPAVLAAFAHLNGSAANRALLEAYPSLSRDMRLSLLEAFGRKRDSVFLELFRGALRSDDPAFRRAAIEALVQSQVPEAVSVLVAAAQTGRDADRAAARAGLRRLAESFRNRGETRRAGEAFLGLYHAAPSTESRRDALEGIRQSPVPEAFEVVKGAIDSADLADLAVPALTGVAKALLAAGRAEEARQAVALLTQRATSTEVVREVIAAARSLGAESGLTHRLGFVTAWSLVGPFPWSAADAFGHTNVHEPEVDLAATYHVKDRQLSWRRYEANDIAGVVDLFGVLGPHANVTAYGFARVSLSKATDAVIRLGSDDGVKLWVNGQAVHEHLVNRGVVMDQDQVPVKLRRGTNTMLIQVTQGGGGWAFCVRLTRPDGAPLPFRAMQQDP